MFARATAYMNGLIQKAKPGYGWLTSPTRIGVGGDANTNIPVSAILGGVYYRSGLAAGRTDTVPTATQLNEVLSDMDVGESLMVLISNQSAQILTIGPATGVAIGGATTVSANTSRFYMLIRNSATTFGFWGL